MENDREFIEAIARDVLEEAHQGVAFFQLLDDQMCPTDPVQPRAACQGSFALSPAILADRGFDSEAVGEIIEVLRAKGAHYACEILFNVAEDSRLKSMYWKSRTEQLPTSQDLE